MAVYRPFPSRPSTINKVISTVSPYPALKGTIPRCRRRELAGSSVFTPSFGQEREGTSRQLPLRGQRERGRLRRHKCIRQIKINRAGGSCFKGIPASSGRALRPPLSIVGNVFQRTACGCADAEHARRVCRKHTKLKLVQKYSSLYFLHFKFEFRVALLKNFDGKCS